MDFNNTEQTKVVEEVTGINLEFEMAQHAEARDKLNIMLASGDYPEIFMGFQFNLSLAEQTLYAKQGVLIPLNDYINKYGIGFKKMFIITLL